MSRVNKMASLNYSGDGDWRAVTLNRSNATSRHVSGAAVVSINYQLSDMMALSVALSALIVFTTLGNLLVLVALFRYRALRTISNSVVPDCMARASPNFNDQRAPSIADDDVVRTKRTSVARRTQADVEEFQRTELADRRC